MNALLAILANIFLLASALGFGTLFHRLLPKTFSELDRTVVTFLGGFGIQGTILFCVGQVWFSRAAILLVLFSGVLTGCVSLARADRESWPALGRVRPPLLPAAIIFSIFLVTAIGGLALPTGDMNDDAIAYHYQGPKVWLREGVIRPVADEVPTFFPVVVETQYAALMSLGGQRAPGFFSLIGFVTILLTTASLAVRMGLNPSEAWWAAALIAAMPTAYRGVYGGFLDAIYASFVLAALRVAFDAEQPKDFVLFGIFCGLPMATKYTGIMAWPLLIFCSFLVSVWAYRRPLPAILKSLGIACGAAIAIASPYYLRNWIVYGSPIYPPPPVLLHFFTPKDLSPLVVPSLAGEVHFRGGGMGRGPLAFFLLPFNMTYHTANFRGAGGIGLVPWALGPIGLMASRRDAFAKGVLLFAVLEAAAWFVTAQESRYAINMYVIAVIFGVLGWQYIVRSASRNARALSAVVVAISILYGMFMIVQDRREDVHAALSRPFEARRTLEETACAEGFDFINREASVRKVMILNPEVAPFFVDKPYIKAFGPWGELPIPDATTIPEVMSQLPSLHVTHILDCKTEDRSFDLPEHPSGLTLVFARTDQRIYQVD